MNRQQTIGKSKILLMLGIMLLIATLAFAITPTQTAFATTSTSDWYGDGTADSYEISTAAELQELAALVNNGDDTFSGETITLKNDINLNPDYTFEFDSDTGLIVISDASDASGVVTYAGTGIKGEEIDDGNTTFDSTASTSGSFYGSNSSADTTDAPSYLREWTEIGSSTDVFQGTFDGGDYTISGLYMNDTDSNTGQKIALFDAIQNATIQNLTVEGIVCGYQYVGGIVGYLENDGEIYNCTNKATVIAKNGEVGGIVGYAKDSTIEYCYNTGFVIGTSSYAGGIVGYAKDSTIEYCYNTGSVIGASYAGGIVGHAEDSASMSIEYCNNSGNITGTSNVGGIVGKT
ncbi:MAG: GLUG motif-containing protein, partial [Bacillota bacterium]